MLCDLSYWAPELHGSVALWPSFSSYALWELCCSLAMPIDGTVLGNGGGGVLQRENF